MKKAAVCFLALLCLCGAALPASAGHFTGEGHQVILNGEFVLRLEKMENWTVVTPDTLDEHMAFLTSDGTGEEAVRSRFFSRNILAEAYHKGLPDGRVRVQVFEDDRTRQVWNLADLTKKQRTALKKELEEELFQGYLHFFNIRDNFNQRAVKWTLSGSVIAYPPAAYESGFFSLRYFNGKAYLLTYTQDTPASNKKLLSSGYTYQRVGDWTDVGSVPEFAGKQETAAADLLPSEALILNVHSGAYELTGVTEKGAQVKVACGGKTVQAKVDGEGNYTAKITLSPGDNVVTSIAEMAKRTKSSAKRLISANDAMAALTLTDYPDGAVDRAKMKVAGRTSPGARVGVRVDGGDAQRVDMSPDGSFSCALQASDWTEHTVEIIASEDGREDCGAKFTFRPFYEDVSKGIRDFQKTLDKGVTGKKISADPGGYVGKRIKMEVYVTDAQRRDGRLILTANISRNKKMPVLLICPDYLDDQIQPKMILTVYGEVDQPSATQPPLPRVQVEYIQYRRTIYKRRWY